MTAACPTCGSLNRWHAPHCPGDPPDVEPDTSNWPLWRVVERCRELLERSTHLLVKAEHPTQPRTTGRTDTP